MPNTDMSSYFNYVVKGLFNGVWFEWFSVTLWILTWLFYLLITLSLIFLTSSVNKEKWSFATRLTTILSRAWFFPMFMLMILGCITFLHATINWSPDHSTNKQYCEICEPRCKINYYKQHGKFCTIVRSAGIQQLKERIADSGKCDSPCENRELEYKVQHQKNC